MLGSLTGINYEKRYNAANHWRFEMTLAKAAKQILTERGQDLLWFGDPDLWHEIYSLGGKRQDMHPLNKWDAVLQAVRQSSLFECAGHIRAINASGTREILHPAFKITAC